MKLYTSISRCFSGRDKRGTLIPDRWAKYFDELSQQSWYRWGQMRPSPSLDPIDLQPMTNHTKRFINLYWRFVKANFPFWIPPIPYAQNIICSCQRDFTPDKSCGGPNIFTFNNGLRKRDVLSCILFNLALKKGIREDGANARGTILFYLTKRGCFSLNFSADKVDTCIVSKLQWK